MAGPPPRIKKYRRDESEVSCCLKYLIFGFNVIFWVSSQAVSSNPLVFRYYNEVGVVIISLFLFLAASWAVHSGCGGVGMEREGNPLQSLQTHQGRLGPCIYSRSGRRHDLRHRVGEQKYLKFECHIFDNYCVTWRRFTGCVGALRENTCLLAVYAIFLAAILLVEISAGILGYFLIQIMCNNLHYVWSFK